MSFCGESEEPGKGWYMLGRVLPTGGAGIGDAKRIAAVSPSRFGFIQRTRNAMSKSLKRRFQLPWGPFFHPPGLPLASWIAMNIRGPVHPLPVPCLVAAVPRHRLVPPAKENWKRKMAIL